MVLLNNAVSGRKPLKEWNKGDEEREGHFAEEIVESWRRRRRRRKTSAPYLALNSGFQLVQAVNAAISRLGKHPVSSSKF